jgi:hypothetical protein
MHTRIPKVELCKSRTDKSNLKKKEKPNQYRITRNHNTRKRMDITPRHHQHPRLEVESQKDQAPIERI